MVKKWIKIILLSLIGIAIVIHIVSCNINRIEFAGHAVIYRGERYVEEVGYFSTGRFIGVSQGYSIYGVENDDEKNYIVLYKGRDPRMYVRENFCPEHDVVKIVDVHLDWEHYRKKDCFEDEAIVDLFQKLIKRDTVYNDLETEELEKTPWFYLYYEDDAVSECFGYLRRLDDKYVICMPNSHEVIFLEDGEYEIVDRYVKMTAE